MVRLLEIFQWMSYSQLSKVSVSSPASSQLGNDLIESIKKYFKLYDGLWRVEGDLKDSSHVLRKTVEGGLKQSRFNSFIRDWVKVGQSGSVDLIQFIKAFIPLLAGPGWTCQGTLPWGLSYVRYSTVQYSTVGGSVVSIVWSLCLRLREYEDQFLPLLAVPLLHFNRGKYFEKNCLKIF